jgi:hypothetical protein
VLVVSAGPAHCVPVQSRCALRLALPAHLDSEVIAKVPTRTGALPCHSGDKQCLIRGVTITVTSRMPLSAVFWGEAALMMELPKRHATPFKGKPVRTPLSAVATTVIVMTA